MEGSPQGPDTRDPRVSVSAGLQDWQEAPEYQELKSKRFEAGQNKSSNYFGLYRATMTGPSAACSKFFKSQGLQERQQVVFLSHGGEDVSNLQRSGQPLKQRGVGARATATRTSLREARWKRNRRGAHWLLEVAVFVYAFLDQCIGNRR